MQVLAHAYLVRSFKSLFNYSPFARANNKVVSLTRNVQPIKFPDNSCALDNSRGLCGNAITVINLATRIINKIM